MQDAQVTKSLIETGLPGLNQHLARINVLAQGHNAVTPVRLEPAAPLSRVKHSTIEPLRSLCFHGKKKYIAIFLWLKNCMIQTEKSYRTSVMYRQRDKVTTICFQ